MALHFGTRGLSFGNICNLFIQSEYNQPCLLSELTFTTPTLFWWRCSIRGNHRTPQNTILSLSMGFVYGWVEVWAGSLQYRIQMLRRPVFSGVLSTPPMTLLFMGTICRSSLTTGRNCVAWRGSNNRLSPLQRVVQTNHQQVYGELTRRWNSTWKKRDHSRDSCHKGRNSCLRKKTPWSKLKSQMFREEPSDNFPSNTRSTRSSSSLARRGSYFSSNPHLCIEGDAWHGGARNGVRRWTCWVATRGCELYTIHILVNGTSFPVFFSLISNEKKRGNSVDLVGGIFGLRTFQERGSYLPRSSPSRSSLLTAPTQDDERRGSWAA